MYRQRRSRRKAFRIKPYMAIAAGAVLLAVLLLLIIDIPQTLLAERGEIQFSREFEAVIIRDEKVIETENYGKAVFIAAEGEKIKKNTSIVEVYKWEYNDKVLNELLELQKNIKDYQENTKLKDIINTELKEFNENIDALSKEIEQVIAGEKKGDIITLERDLKKLMTERKDYLKEAVKPDNQLNALYQQETDLLSRIDDWKKIIKAENDGYVSFYFDGCEKYINIQNMDKLTRKNIDSILKGEISSLIEDDKAARPLYRMVKANRWYVLIYSDDKMAEFKKDVKFSLSFKDVYDKKYTGKVTEERKDGRGAIYTFLVNDDVSSLLRARKIKVTIENTFTGIKVPESAVKEKDGAYGVYLRNGASSVFVPVNVSIIKDGEAIVLPLDNGGVPLENGQVEY